MSETNSSAQFYNPLIDQYVDIDDDEFGHHSLDDVDMKRSFSPDIIDKYKQSMSTLKPEDLQLIKDVQSRVNGFHQQEQARKQALHQLLRNNNDNDGSRGGNDYQQQPQQELEQKNDAPTTLGEGFENRPSSKPIWNRRETNQKFQNVDQKNIDAINSVQPANSFEKLKALMMIGKR